MNPDSIFQRPVPVAITPRDDKWRLEGWVGDRYFAVTVVRSDGARPTVGDYYRALRMHEGRTHENGNRDRSPAAQL